MKYRVFHLFSAFMLLALLLPVCAFAETVVSTVETVSKYDSMPDALRVVQQTDEQSVGKNVIFSRAYPATQSVKINTEIKELVDAFAAARLPELPERIWEEHDAVRLDVGSIVSRSGESLLSFLVLAERTDGIEHTSTDFTTRVYDVMTDRQVMLTDLFDEDSEGWALMAEAVRAQLTEAFPKLTPDSAALDTLCQREALEKADFTLGAARLMLTYPASAVYPGKNTLLHVILYYPEIRSHMNAYGQRQTDNSRFKLLSLTFDDGGGKFITRNVLSRLRKYGAGASFFLVGRTFANNHYNLARQQDAGYTLQSHSYSHKYLYESITIPEIVEENVRLSEELSDLVGVVPHFFRVPGGNEKYAQGGDYGMPLMHWSLSSGDAGNPNVERIVNRVIYGAKDGDVILMHDINEYCPRYLEKILNTLTDRGFMFVTLEELFASQGVTPQPNVTYMTPTEIREFNE